MRTETEAVREEGAVDAACAVCDDPQPLFRWTDTHGIAACRRCGAPYRILHYEENGRVDKPRELLIVPEWLSATREYWQEVRRNVAPGYCNFAGSSYEVATDEDFRASREWWEARLASSESEAESRG